MLSIFYSLFDILNLPACPSEVDAPYPSAISDIVKRLTQTLARAYCVTKKDKKGNLVCASLTFQEVAAMTQIGQA